MGSRTREGYPIPADKNPFGLSAELIFPYDQAATLVTAAQRVGNTAVRGQVELIRKMLGNPNDVSTVLGAWQTAISELTMSIDGSDDGNGLTTARASVNARWNGSAKDAAVAYLDQLLEMTPAQRTVMKEITDQINNFSALVTQNYATAIVHITKYAAIVAELSGGLLEEIREALTLDGGSIETKILEALGQFMEETGKVIESVITYKNNLAGTMDAIITRAGEIAVPAAIAPDALDTTGWQPRNPTGPGWGSPS
ncbi:hypothetical protein IU443_07540 [Nocardia farcinica]|uniref:WXG100 family type VII secretion target n=1 Tax=Nocardia farcinica TaxID=37329 RepID=A0A0H5NWE7_NOCFR|nr:hypothetical protein [Nocardia farcinica]AXK86707.1 hypothetical protein DXT66_14675 [Nocardia farcinica]MBA4857080.1 hypothetical protein [Nocardia farcinica]MBC9817157.1 hypothetical protein [Nocardia farcinica]MBF6233665.1 hypothetical protein [Nocardia farcinica]MBF6251828.1 hypothetical protein [Nocardia farcinica]